MAPEELARMPEPTTVFVAVFSHGDVIRSAVAYFAGVPLDLFLRLEIRPASISSVRFYEDALQILGVDDTGDLYA